MNYLAHLYLAEDSEKSILGNILGDFVKGPIGNDYDPAIVKGIWTHRKVDVFTDSHEIFRESKRLISPSRRRFAGIIVDLVFDHFLAKNWASYSELDLDRFIRETYELLNRNMEILPEKFRLFLPRMINEDWLGSYRMIDGTGKAIDRISERLRRRFNRGNSLLGAIDEVESNYNELEDNFNAFFPELVSFVEDLRITERSEPGFFLVRGR